MNTNERTHLTPAQAALLTFVEQQQAHILFEHLSDTLSICISGFCPPDTPDDLKDYPPAAVLESWYYTLQLLRHLHELSLDKKS